MKLLYPLRRPPTGLLLSESFDCYDAFGHGAFQLRMLSLAIFALVAVNCHALVLPIIARDVEHWCKQPSDLNISAAEWRYQFVPVQADGRLSGCYVYEHLNYTGGADVTACRQWDYGNGSATTVVSHWNLVCHRRVLLLAALAVQNAGSVVIPAVAGPYADYIGRVPVVIVAVCVLLASTVGSCLATSYVLYAILRFLCSGAVIAYCSVNAVGTFEAITHGRRPLDVVFAGTLGYVLSHLWFIITMLFEQHWAVKQAIFLAPTLLSLGAFFVAKESPKWLVAKGNMDEAEYVMLEGAKLNRFPLPSTACLMVKLREELDNHNHLTHDDEGAFHECSLRRRLLIVIVSHFSLTFTFYTVIFYTIPRNKVVLEWASFIGLLVVYALTRALITRVPQVRVLRLCFLTLGGILCLTSAVITTKVTVVAEVLAALSKAFASVAIVVNLAYVLELFPTALRASAFCWTIASGRVGAVCASVFFGLHKAGLEDVAFFACGCALFGSLLALRHLPRAVGVECAKREGRNASWQRESAIEYMKKTLQPQAGRKGSASRSVNSRSSSVVTKSAGSRRSSRRRSLSASGLHQSSE